MSSRRLEELEGRLTEAQQSLSVALARIEAYRCREKLLLRDYEVLRLRARHAGVDVSPPAPQELQLNGGASAKQQPRQLAISPLQQAASVQPTTATAPPQHLALTPLDSSPPIWLRVNGSRVPGTVLVEGDDLHFVQTHARISASDYLGLRALRAEDLGQLQQAARGSSDGAEAADAGAAAGQQGGGSGKGVLSGAASWLAQRVRTSGSGSGDAADSPPASGIGFTNIMTTIMHSLEEDGSSSETEASEAELAADSRQHSAAVPPMPSAAAAPAAGHITPGNGPTPYTGPHESPQLQAWDVAWADEYGHMRRLAFEAGLPARAFIAKQTQRWAAAAAALDAPQQPLVQTAYAGALSVQVCAGCQAPVRLQGVAVQPATDGRSLTARVFSALDLELAAPDHMRPTELPPPMSERSGIMSGETARALAGGLPPRFRMSSWSLLYSTERHGISLQTLYRRSKAAPTLLVIRDSAGHVFGSFTSEGWRVATRFYGTGETFVFQLQPHRVAWRWRRAVGDDRNDYFQFGTPESLAVGGGGHFAIFLQEDLLRGSSGISATFGNPCLAGSTEFTVGQLEVWAVAPT